MTISTRSVAIFVASMAIGTTLPLAAASTLTASQTEDSVLRTPDGTVVSLHRAYSLRDRYDFNRAVAIYRQYLQTGRAAPVIPNINDRSTIDHYLETPLVATGSVHVPAKRTEPLSTNDYVKPEQEVINIDRLSQQERAALQRSEKLGTCWDYPNFSIGYMELCQKFIAGKTAVPTSGLGSDIVRSRMQAHTFSSSSIVPSKVLQNYINKGRIVPRGKGGGIDNGKSYSSTRVMPY